MIIEKQKIKEAPRPIREQIVIGKEEGRDFICLEKKYFPDYHSETPICEYKLVELETDAEGEPYIIIYVFSSEYDYIPVRQQAISFSLEILEEIKLFLNIKNGLKKSRPQ